MARHLHTHLSCGHLDHIRRALCKYLSSVKYVHVRYWARLPMQDRAPHQDPDLISLWRARSAIHTLQCAGHLDLEDDYSDMENQRPGCAFPDEADTIWHYMVLASKLYPSLVSSDQVYGSKSKPIVFSRNVRWDQGSTKKRRRDVIWAIHGTAFNFHDETIHRHPAAAASSRAEPLSTHTQIISASLICVANTKARLLVHRALFRCLL
ncbi:hypothetical protein SCLCIDRAFT_974872 [Scleroderma citrinum Foug A]|uniref:Uncharacterized protein n=1 Tax=Scleroderma citrinum Foug A TaxID=1036808 RepID=A0A0C3DUZ8_9AGAM|nr:hypothetical protein SCLCIDRAFT_974872 [Scleroderma citrinum Foug A]